MADDEREELGPPRDAELVARALRRYSSEFVLFISREGALVGASHDTVLGYTIDHLGRHIGEFVHPGDLPGLFDTIERGRTVPGFRDRVRSRARHADGSWRQFDTVVFSVDGDGEIPPGLVLRARDVTDETPVADPASDDLQDRFLPLAESLPLGILSADARSWVVFTNAAAEQLFAASSDQLLGHGWERLVHPDDRAEVLAALADVVVGGVAQEVMFRVQTGLFVRWALARFVPLGAPRCSTGWIATIEDVTDRRRTESELTHQATHDPLTGLPNRMLLEDRLQQACARLGGQSESVSVLFIDLDGFKSVNDTYGHSVGDQVLVEIAGRLRRVVRSVDTVARLGGDEFVAFCEALPSREVREVVSRIHAAFDVPLVVRGELLHIGASIGVESTRDPSITFDELLSRADREMYRQKRAR